MTFILLEPVTITRSVNTFYIFRTAVSVGLAFLFMYLIKDKMSLRIAGISFLIGIAFESLATVIGVRSFVPSELSVFFIIILLGGLEIAGATSIVWSISSILYKKKDNNFWKLKLAIWGGIVLCITVIFPLLTQH